MKKDFNVKERQKVYYTKVPIIQTFETKKMPIPRQNVYVFIQWLANLQRNKL